MIKKVFLIHHTHFDIGFTDFPEVVLQQQRRYLDQAVRYCLDHPEYRWTIESGRLLRDWLCSRPETARQQIVELLRSGQMELGGFDTQILTETVSFSELVENVSLPVSLGRQFGFPVETAILDDIGGLAGELPSVMEAHNVHNLILGTGVCQTELPWAELPRLFYWKSCGGGRVLVWNLGLDRQEKSTEARFPAAVYGLGGYFLGYHGFPEFLGRRDMGIQPPTDGIPAGEQVNASEYFRYFAEILKRNGYPYEEILLQYGGDNRGPAPALVELVQAINDSGQFPEVVLTTPTPFFQFMTKKYSRVIPEIHGILTDPWNLRMNTVPSVLKRYRKAQRQYDDARLRGGKDDELMDSLLLTGDHTFGNNIWGWQKIARCAPLGIAAPDFDAVRRSWQIKAHYAENALWCSQKLKRRLESHESLSEEARVVIRNNSLHCTHGPVECYFGDYAPSLISLTDESGREVPRQLCGKNRWVLQVSAMNALEIRRLKCVFSTTDYPLKDESLETVPVPAELSCGGLQLHFSPDGALLQISSRNGRKLLAGDEPFGEVSVETIHDVPENNDGCGLKPCVQRSCVHAALSQAKTIRHGELFTDVQVDSQAGNLDAVCIFRVWHQYPRMDMTVRIHKPKTADKQCVHVAFPFFGKEGTFHFDQNAGQAELSDLLPGAMQDLFLGSRYVAMELPEATAVICCPDAPMFQVGDRTIGMWRKALPFIPVSNKLYGLLYNNLCNTDAPAWSAVQESFQYSIFFQDGVFSAPVAQAYWNECTALEAEYGFAAACAGVKGLPAELRVHTDARERLWLENLSGHREVAYAFEWNKRHYAGTLPPYALQPMQ